MAHVLVLGGTGKLSGFVRFLAARGNLVSVVSKDEAALAALAQAAEAAHEKVIPLLVDYHNLDQLSEMLEETVARHGPFQLAVVRIHPPCPAVRQAVASFLNTHSPVCRFFEVLSEEDHEQVVQQERLEPSYERILYRRILLGAVQQQGQTRWPNSEEIAEAAIRAVRDDLHEIVIGELRRSA